MSFTENMQHGCVYMTSDKISAKHMFTTRIGGASKGVFASWNLGVNRGDDDAADDCADSDQSRDCSKYDPEVYSGRLLGAPASFVSSGGEGRSHGKHCGSTVWHPLGVERLSDLCLVAF